MRRIIWTVGTVVVVLLWLVFTYGPGTLLPVVAYPAWSDSLLAALTVAGFTLFIAIQVWLTWSTDKVLASSRNQLLVDEFRLQRGRELLWTVLPIGMMLLVAIAVVAWAALV